MPQKLLLQLGDLANPVGIAWLALCMLSVAAARRRSLKTCLVATSAALILWIGGATPLCEILSAQLEAVHPAQDWTRLPKADCVVMLGGLLNISRHDANGFEISGAGDRILATLEAARRIRPKAILLLGGQEREGEKSESQSLIGWIKAWGLLPSNIEILTAKPCVNTHDEAVATEIVAKERHFKSILLVTSATHMKRAVAVFRQCGVDVTPLPCDFRALRREELHSGNFRIVPSLDSLLILQSVIHEHLSWYYYRFRGWISPASSTSSTSQNPGPPQPVTNKSTTDKAIGLS